MEDLIKLSTPTILRPSHHPLVHCLLLPLQPHAVDVHLSLFRRHHLHLHLHSGPLLLLLHWSHSTIACHVRSHLHLTHHLVVSGSCHRMTAIRSPKSPLLLKFHLLLLDLPEGHLHPGLMMGGLYGSSDCPHLLLRLCWTYWLSGAHGHWHRRVWFWSFFACMVFQST